jgi:hypothetical protein
MNILASETMAPAVFTRNSQKTKAATPYILQITGTTPVIL